MIKLLKRYWAARQAEKELRSLDDRALADIGLSRGMIGHIIRQEALRQYP